MMKETHLTEKEKKKLELELTLLGVTMMVKVILDYFKDDVVRLKEEIKELDEGDD